MNKLNHFELMTIFFSIFLLLNCQPRSTSQHVKVPLNYPDSFLEDSHTISKVETIQAGREDISSKFSANQSKSIPDEEYDKRQDASEQSLESKQPEKTLSREVEPKSSADSLAERQLPDTAPFLSDEGTDASKKIIPATEKSEERDLADHGLWDGLLKKYVDALGQVDYLGFVRDRKILEQYLDQVSQQPVSEQASRSEQLAFWINVYNAYTVYLIAKNHPVGSILDLHQGKPWDVKWIEIGDQSYSLNDIEHSIIRNRFGDPRIHFAVNCAAKSCPPLANKAFTADNYEQLVESLTRAFINNPKYNKITSEKIEISKIFEWYAADFGDLIAFLNRYSQIGINHSSSVIYIEYDWSLNGR